MIVGVGIDIAELERITSSVRRFGERFLVRILTPSEMELASSNVIPFLASRFAAKEAAAKALGTGFSQGVTFQDIEVRSDDLGKPTIHFHNAAQARFLSLGAVRAHLSISHGRDNAVAVVILEA